MSGQLQNNFVNGALLIISQATGMFHINYAMLVIFYVMNMLRTPQWIWAYLFINNDICRADNLTFFKIGVSYYQNKVHYNDVNTIIKHFVTQDLFILRWAGPVQWADSIGEMLPPLRNSYDFKSINQEFLLFRKSLNKQSIQDVII